MRKLKLRNLDLSKIDAKELSINWLSNYYITYMLKDSCRTKEMISDLISELLDSEKESKMINQLQSTFESQKYKDDNECNIELNKLINFVGGIIE
jgi:hypothetical protein